MMKRVLFSMAILAVVASCSTNDVTDIAPAQQSVDSEISFYTINDRITKAANDVGSPYKVYAVSSAAYAAWYISDSVVTTPAFEGDNETEAYAAYDTVQNGPYYWPSDVNLNFFAYAPYTETEVNITDTSAAGVINLDYAVPTTADEDFTFAYLEAQTSESKDGAAAFVFSHMLAKATVDVVLGEDLISAGYYFTLTSATFNVLNDGVTVDVAADNATDAIAPVIAPVTGTASYNCGLSAAIVLASASEEDEYDVDYYPTSADGTAAMMFAPHVGADDEADGYEAETAATCSVTLTGIAIYKNGTAVVPSTNATYKFDPTQDFDAGSAYAVTITMDLTDAELGGLTEMIFTSAIDSSADWTSVSVAL